MRRCIPGEVDAQVVGRDTRHGKVTIAQKVTKDLPLLLRRGAAA